MRLVPGSIARTRAGFQLEILGSATDDDEGRPERLSTGCTILVIIILYIDVSYPHQSGSLWRGSNSLFRRPEPSRDARVGASGAKIGAARAGCGASLECLPAQHA